jgi:DNA-binding MarR family transcriptional regulator
MALFFDSFGISVSQAFILFCLLDHDGSILSEIGARAQIEASSLTAMTDKLDRMGLVERTLDPHNRRIVRLYITPKGRETAEIIKQRGEKFDQYLRGNLGQDLDKLFDCLASINSSIDKLSQSTDGHGNIQL